MCLNKSNEEKQQNIDVKPKKPSEPDQLWIWDSTSMSDVRNIKRLIFNKSVYTNENNSMKIKEGYHNTNDNLGVKLRRLSGEINTIDESNYNKYSSNNNENIVILRNDVIFQINNNLEDRLGDYLETVIHEMTKKDINELALSYEDEIFKYVDVKEFKKIYNKLHNNIVSRHKIKNINNMNKGLKIIMYKPPRKIMDPAEMNKLIKEYHSTPLGGHIGIKRCINKLKQMFVWKNMSKMVKNFINNCENCAKNKITKYI